MSETSPPPNADSPAFADRVRAAVYWRWGSQAAMQLIMWSATLLVVRLLDPRDYGLFAMTQAVTAALNFLNGYSYGTSLIQAREVTERRIGQVFGLLIVSNGLLAIAQFALAPYAAAYYGQPMVATMLRVQSLIYLATPFIALPSSLLARALDFRMQARVSFYTAISGAAMSLALAFAGCGVWTLVWAPIAMYGVRALGLTIAAGGVPRPVFDFRGAADIVGFGTALTVVQLFWIVQSQADIVIAGRFLSPHALGLYAESLFLVLIFTARFLPPLNEVALPAYAELYNAGKPIGAAFIATARMIMLVAIPFYVGISLVADPIVRLFFGPKWLDMIPIISSLALIMPAQTLQIICSPATNAIGRPGIGVATGAAGAIIMPLCFLIGASAGTTGLIAAWYVAVPLLLVVTLALTLPAIGAGLWALARAMLPALGAAAAMACAVVLIAPHVAGWPTVARLALLSTLGAAIYVGVLWQFWPALVSEALTTLGRRPSVSAPADRTTTTADGIAA